jgi:hypothetical protein
MRAHKLRTLTIAAILTIEAATAQQIANKPESIKVEGTRRTLTGAVSDTMCGAHHMMADDTQCVHACIKQGSKYALVVGQEVYTLNGHDDDFEKLANKQVSVTGAVSGDAITVTKVRELRARSSP